MKNPANISDRECGFQRKLGLFDATLLSIGGVLGSGIFMTSGFVAQALPSPLLFLSIWLIGGGVTLCGALSFGELGALFPRAGGQYVYIREAYGLGPAFIYGWAFFGFIECGSIAALATGFAEFLSPMIPALSTKIVLAQVRLPGYVWTFSAGQIVAVLVIIILTVINCYGLKSGMLVQNLLTIIRIGSILIFVGAALIIGKMAGTISIKEIFSVTSVVWPGFKALGLALVAVFWTYDGWYSVNCTAGEVRNPGRVIPLSIFLGTWVIIALYLLVNFVYLKALPIGSMKGIVRVGELAAARLFGPGVGILFAALIMITILGCLNTTILYGPRVYYAMARDGAFFRSMGDLNSRFCVPTKGFVGQAVWSILLCISGGFQALYEYVVFALLLFFAATGFSVFILRRKYPLAHREYRVWGFPMIPLIFISTTLAIFINTLITQPKRSLIGTLVLAAGLPAYFFWRKRARSLPL